MRCLLDPRGIEVTRWAEADRRPRLGLKRIFAPDHELRLPVSVANAEHVRLVVREVLLPGPHRLPLLDPDLNQTRRVGSQWLEERIVEACVSVVPCFVRTRFFQEFVQHRLEVRLSAQKR